jgi:hexosaminidase
VSALPVIPTPAAFEQGSGALRLDSITSVSVRERELLEVAERFRRTMEQLAGIGLPTPVVETAAGPDGIRMELDGVARLEDESSSLVVDDTGVRVAAATPEGAHRALTSLVQLAAVGDGVVPSGTVDDAPELGWRGLSLDVVRTFIPLDEVKRVIDMLSLCKLNVLHLHLTDNEGWRLEIESRPRLTEVGSTGAVGDRPGGYYTQAEFRELVDYARTRFVTVVPEIDLPGHVRAAVAAYPELSPSRAPYLDPESDEVWRFVREVMTEVTALSPGPFVHIGGDEAFGMDEAAHAEFVGRLTAIVKGLGKHVVGWQEICRADVGPDDVVQHWIDFADTFGGDKPFAGFSSLPSDLRESLVDHFRVAQGDPARIAQKRARVVLSPTSHCYLDRPHGDASTLAEQEARRGRLGLAFYPATSLRAMYEWDPFDAVPAVDPAAIVGIEAAMWCETVETMDDLELLLLPRLAGVAEAAWSPSRRAEWADHRARLGEHARLWRRAGWSWYHADSVEWAVG